MIDSAVIKTNIMIHEAKRWLNFVETGGNNKGQVVEMFQRAVDNVARGEPWCMAFVQHCIKEADKVYEIVFKENKLPSKILKSEHCMTVLTKSPKELISPVPKIGSIVIWNYVGTSNGHTGVVIDVKLSDSTITTIEGNTGPSSGEVVREGDGVYKKTRSIHGTAKMQVKGYICPWGV